MRYVGGFDVKMPPKIPKDDAMITPVPLTDTAIRNAKPAENAVHTLDGEGLYVEVSPAGGRLWRLICRMEGKEKLLALGAYPAVGPKDASDRRDAARKA